LKHFLTLISCLVILGIGNGFEFQADANTIGLWHFNEGTGDSVFDVSGHGNHGRIIGATWQTGIWGRNLKFDGIDDHIVIIQNSSLEPKTALSIECLVYAEQQYRTSGPIRLVRKTGPLDDGYILSWQQGSGELIELRLDNFTQGQFIRVSDPDNNAARKHEWLYLAATYKEGDFARLYINGQLVSSQPSNNYRMFHTDNLYIAGYPNNGNEMFTGQIDEVRISNIDRTPMDIQNTFNGFFDFGPEIIPIPSPTYDKRPVFRWYSMDSASVYEIQIDTNPSFKNPLIKIAVADTAFIPLADLPVGNIYWRVSSDVMAGYYSKIGSFVIIDVHAPVPVLYRFNGKDVRSELISFRWQPVTDAQVYKLLIDTSVAFTNPMTLINTSDTAFTPLVRLSPGMYYWKVSCDIDFAEFSTPDSVNIIMTMAIGSETFNNFPMGLQIGPNPFNVATTIQFNNPGEKADIRIYSVDGKEIFKIDNTKLNVIKWDGSRYSSGIYMVSLKIGQKVFNRKILLVR
jgi:hypothetical protein